MERLQLSYSALIVSSSVKFVDSVLPILKKSFCTTVSTATNGAMARRCVLEENYDIIIINTPLTDEFGTKLSLDFVTGGANGIMLFVKAEYFDETSERVTPYGVLTISKPTSEAIVSQSFSLLFATRERLRRMEQKTAGIEEKMEEIRLVNRAKWVLIEELKMTEPDAHRYIEKTAMDRCVSKAEIAKSIIHNYK